MFLSFQFAMGSANIFGLFRWDQLQYAQFWMLCDGQWRIRSVFHVHLLSSSSILRHFQAIHCPNWKWRKSIWSKEFVWFHWVPRFDQSVRARMSQANGRKHWSTSFIHFAVGSLSRPKCTVRCHSPKWCLVHSSCRASPSKWIWYGFLSTNVQFVRQFWFCALSLRSNCKVSITICAFYSWRSHQMLQPSHFIATLGRWPPKATRTWPTAYLNRIGCTCQLNYRNTSSSWLPMHKYHFSTMHSILSHWIWKLLLR